LEIREKIGAACGLDRFYVFGSGIDQLLQGFSRQGEAVFVCRLGASSLPSVFDYGGQNLVILPHLTTVS
jgi:hypothetical protein